MQLKFSVALCLLVTVAPMARVARAEVNAEDVRKSIDRGVAFLKREQDKDGKWPEHLGYPGGVTALCTLALLNCGVPADDPQVAAALAYLRKVPPTRTYVVSLQIMAFAAATPKKDALEINRLVRWLEDKQGLPGRQGGWSYPEGPPDNSNSQFALLALHEASRVGVSANPRTWRLALDYWKGGQNHDGSWGYRTGIPGSGSMTCAGIGAMVMAMDKLEPGDAKVEDGHVRCCIAQEDDDSVQRGLNWLGRNFSVVTNPGTGRNQVWLLYYLYGVERVGRLSNQRFIGAHDWYREGAQYLVDKQDDLSGFWKGVGMAEENPNVSTSLALLFLSKGRRPVVAAKLKHEPLDNWNHHRNDLANLVIYTEKKWGRDLTWQIIDIDAATPDDLMEAPVQFISGEAAPNFTDEQVQELREYINRGGFIFADACCGGQEFDRGFRTLVERMFPEQEYRLHLLPPEHAIWTAEEPVDPKYVRPLWGVDVGCRTSIVYCPDNLSCYWELARTEQIAKYPAEVQGQVQAALSMGVNVLAYATNREPKYKLQNPQLVEDKRRDEFERAKLYIAKVRHNGGWNAAPRALRNLLTSVSREAGLRVSTDLNELTLDSDQLFNFPMLFMHGRNAFRFTEAQRKRLKTYLERGGVLMADSVCASDEFTASFRQEMAAMFPDKPLARIPASDAMFTPAFGGFELKTVERRDPQRRSAQGSPLRAAVRQVEPELDGVKLGDRYAVIFSRYDLSCALENQASLECAGYTSADAARIGLNIVLYAMHQ